MTSLKTAVTTFLRLSIAVIGVAIALGVLLVLGLFLTSRYYDGPALVRAGKAHALVVIGTASAAEQSQAEKERTALVAAWILGNRTGLYAATTVQIKNRRPDNQDPGWSNLQTQAENQAAAMARMTKMLGVALPPPFLPTQTSRAISDFVALVDSVSNDTAVALAGKYGPRVSAVYKLGLLWGFSQLYRGNDPGARNVFASEITLYSDQLKMPPDLKNAMTGPSRTRAPFRDVMAEAEQISKTIAEYWNKP